MCYGLLIPWLGFYWDDISYQYSLHVFGPLGMVDTSFTVLIARLTSDVDAVSVRNLLSLLRRALPA